MSVMDAIVYATKMHDGQRRKVDGLPYISHPYRVGMLLTKGGYRDEVVIAGILHDVVEDTNATLDDIHQLFGSDVAELVDYASEPDKAQSWEERKKHTIEAIKTAPLEAKLVVCADKIDNLTSILENEKEYGDRLWDSFKKDKPHQQWYYTSIFQSITSGIEEQKYPDLFKQLEKLVKAFKD